jgi:hypothetical protein
MSRVKIPISIGLWSPKLAVAWLRDNGYKKESEKVRAEFVASGAIKE